MIAGLHAMPHDAEPRTLTSARTKDMAAAHRFIIKNVLFLITASVLVCASCSIKQPESKGPATADTLATTQLDEILVYQFPTALVVQGKDIWVRDNPKTGNVVMKLNTGDSCRVLERGPFQIIRTKPNYWYKIEFNGTQGWLFGAQSDLPPPDHAGELMVFWKDYHDRVCTNCPINPSDESFTRKETVTGEDPSDYHETMTTWSLQDLGENFVVIAKDKEIISSAGKTIENSFEAAYYPGSKWFLTGHPATGVVAKVLPAKNDVIFLSLRTELHPSGAAGLRQSWYTFRLDFTHPDRLDSLQQLAVSYNGVFLNELSPGKFTSAAAIDDLGNRRLRLLESISEFDGRIDEVKQVDTQPRETILVWSVERKLFIAQ